MRKFEPKCPACRNLVEKTDVCQCGQTAHHTHHDYPSMTIECEYCGKDCCSDPVPVYSCACGEQFVFGQYSDRAKLHLFDYFQPVWQHRGSSDPKLLDRFRMGYELLPHVGGAR